MPILGFSDLRDKGYPALWDLPTIKKIELADGTTMDQVIADVNAALRLLNGDLLAAPHIGGLLAVTDDYAIEYPVGVSNGIEEATEYGTPNPARGKMTGHMLPIYKYDRGLGWTQMYLREARRAQLDADIQSLITDARDHFPKKLLTRFFASTAVTIGTSGKSVPFCDGGTADSTYVPLTNPQTGKTFLYTHTHMLREADFATALAAAVPHLLEHGHQPPFDMIGSETDLATYTTATGWKTPQWSDIAYMNSTTERAPISDITQYVGYLETKWGIVRVWITPRVPTGYFGMYKAYGQGDARNPMWCRMNPKLGFGWQLVPGNWVNAPTMMAVAYSEYGFGVGRDRTNGVLAKIAASGSYSAPTIS